jgi:two-component system cell cycle sensor histidine kinase/response regulator CckA
MSGKPTYEELEQRIKELGIAESERKIIEDKLKNSLSLLEATLESSADGILVIDTHGKISRFNSKFTKMWRIPEEILDYRDDDKALSFVLDQLKDPEAFNKKVKELYDSPESSSFDVLEFIDGRIFERYSQPQRIGNLVVGRVWSFRDVTKSRQAEKALRESEKKYRLIAENTADLISVLNMDMHFSYVSPASIRLRGFTVEEAMAQTLEQVLTPESMKDAISVFEEEMLKEASGTSDPNRMRILELEQYKKDGSTAWMEVSLSFLRDSDGKPVQILAVTRDISDRKQAEKALRESEKRFRANFQYAPVGVAVIDTETRFLEVNRQLCQILGYDPAELIGRSFNDFTHPEDRDGGRQRWRQLLDGGIDFNQAEKRYIHKSGKIVWSIVTNSLIRNEEGKPRYFVSHLLDISTQKQAQEESERLEKQLYQAQKMEALGTLAGGIAHDFNNLLMAIQGRTSIMLMDKGPSHPDFENLSGIEDHIESATELTKQLLGLARGGKYEVKPTDLNGLIDKENRMFGRTKKEITIHGKYAEDLLPVEIDRSQIEQVLLNLYVNAWQAMPGGGNLYVKTENVTLDDNFIRPLHVTPGKYVKISVRDTGTGMDKKTLERAFDPFFTTKKMGRGTGLGLASAYGIIKNHGGVLNVYSEKSHGSTFEIYLPASEKEAIEEPETTSDALGGSETILLVDDEDIIFEIAGELLGRLGYNVLTAGSGREAIDIYEKNKDRIDMVILDMIMPDMSGRHTYEKMKDIDPRVKVLLSSGYSINGYAQEILDLGCNGFVQKPYNAKQLSQKLREILDDEKA